jgi:hypothetical protein
VHNKNLKIYLFLRDCQTLAIQNIAWIFKPCPSWLSEKFSRFSDSAHSQQRIWVMNRSRSLTFCRPKLLQILSPCVLSAPPPRYCWPASAQPAVSPPQTYTERESGSVSDDRKLSVDFCYLFIFSDSKWCLDFQTLSIQKCCLDFQTLPTNLECCLNFPALSILCDAWIARLCLSYVMPRFSDSIHPNAA